MIMGTGSSVGKSLLTAGLIRTFRNRGMKVCPFKPQNMSSLYYSTPQGLKMSTAQAFQAQAAGLQPHPQMNPILLIPNSDTGSQVMVMGEPYKQLQAAEYYRERANLLPIAVDVFEQLNLEYNMVVEGAGSPAEINLRHVDIANFGFAENFDIPVILVADIDRGGVFAAVYGTYMLLSESDRSKIKGFIINKFRGDKKILDPGIEKIEEITGLKSYGVMPFIKDLKTEEEDGPVSEPNKILGDKDKEFELLANIMEENLDIAGILRVLEEGIN